MTDQSADDLSKGQVQSFSSAVDQSATTNTEDKLDIEAVLRRDRHAQEHIKRLEAERKADRERLLELERELAKAKTVDDLMSWRKQNSYRTDEDEPTSRADIGKIDVDAIAKAAAEQALSKLSEQERSAQEQKNFMEALSVLKEKHGEHVDKKVEERARDLGMSVPDMVNIARRSPKAFFEVMGEKDIKTPAPTSSGYTNHNSSPNVTAADMMKIMRDPKQAKTWKDPEYQRQLRLKILEESRKSNKG